MEVYKALKFTDDDEIGALAQRCFHIEYVEKDKKYYHFLDYDANESLNSENEQVKPKSVELNKHSLIKNGKLTKLPCCEICYDKLNATEK